MKIAILIPTYNASKTVAETLVSVQKNIYANKQLDITTFIADDCSLDDTLDIIKNSWYLHTDILKIMPSVKNQGERENLNRVIREIENEFNWVYILHADDIAKENWTSLLYYYAQKYPNAASITTSYDVLYENGRIEPGENKDEENLLEGSKEAIKSTLKNGTWFHISGCAINTQTFKKIGYFQKNLPQYGDMEFVIRIFLQQLSILYVPKSLTLYRQISTSVSSNSFKTNLDILEFSSLVAHFKSYFNREELVQQNKKFQTFLNKRIVKSAITLNIKRLFSALKLKKYVKGILLKSAPNKYQFPMLRDVND